MTCPEWCLSASEQRDFCMAERGCKANERGKCPEDHSRALGNGIWHIAAGAELGRFTKRSGSAVYAVKCPGCGKQSTDIGNRVARQMIAAGHLIVWERNELGGVDCCVIGCDEPGFEMHHFAPRNAFPDADDWPYLPLCRSHHRYWHVMMDGYRWTKPTDLQLNTATNNTES